MNMLKTFFEIGSDKSVFEGLKIFEEKELCDKYMGKFPVISISLKGIEGQNFQIAREAMQYVIGSEIRRFSFLTESEKLDTGERKDTVAGSESHNRRFSQESPILHHLLEKLELSYSVLPVPAASEDQSAGRTHWFQYLPLSHFRPADLTETHKK